MDRRSSRPLQHEADRQTQSLNESAWVLIEAPTGERTTEATLYLADHTRAASRAP